MSNTLFDDAEAIDFFGDVSSEGYDDGDMEDIDESYRPASWYYGRPSYGRPYYRPPYNRPSWYPQPQYNRPSWYPRPGRYPRPPSYRPGFAGRPLRPADKRFRTEAQRRAEELRERQRAAWAQAQGGMVPARMGDAGPLMEPMRDPTAAVQETGFGRELRAAEMGMTRAAVQELGLESEAQGRAFAGTLSAQERRIGRSEVAAGVATVANTLANQLSSSYPNFARNRFVRFALPVAPLLLLKPARRESGFQGFISDPRVWGTALAAGLAIAGEINSRVQKAEKVRITRFTNVLAGNGEFAFEAQALDSGGAVLPKRIKWSTTNPRLIDVDENTGLVKALNSGATEVIATLDGTTVDEKIAVFVR